MITKLIFHVSILCFFIGNAKNTIEALLELGIIPIVNENDCVATEEISFGDNDRLGAALAGLIRADRFVMLTDQDGIFNDDPTKNQNSVKKEPTQMDNGSELGQNVITSSKHEERAAALLQVAALLAERV
mgnify:CR=1 FL=1